MRYVFGIVRNRQPGPTRLVAFEGMFLVASSVDPRNNHILAALSEESYRRVRSDLELVAMPLSWVLYESGGQLKHIYFPVTGIVSLLYVTASGASSEIALTGNEGLVGISL